jgi:hypothetical protein
VTDDDRKGGAWDYVEGAMLEDEIERLAALTPEQRREELKKAGVEPGAGRAIAERAIAEVDATEKAAGKPAKGEVVSLDAARARKRGPLWALMAVAASVLLVAGMGYELRPDIEAYFQPAPTATGPSPRTPSPAEMRAASIRAQAYAMCDTHQWDACELDLDKAAEIDRPGDTDPKVVRARVGLWRARALEECAKEYFPRCTEDLDKAKELDPSGEKEPAIASARAAIAAAPEASKFDGVKMPSYPREPPKK